MDNKYYIVRAKDAGVFFLDKSQIYQQIVDDGKEYTEVFAYRKDELTIDE